MAVPLIMRVNGRVSREKTTRGPASHKAVRSGACRAKFFGMSSPKATCIKVISKRARAVAAVWMATALQVSRRNSNQGATSLAKAGSPTQPRAILASVTPSCVAAMERSSRLMARSASLAPLTPRRTISSMRVLRTDTRANSMATNKPLNATKAGTLSSSRISQTQPSTPRCNSSPAKLCNLLGK